MEVDQAALDRLTEIVSMGGAVCLLGAGYSIAATDQNGLAVPSTSDLISEIKKKLGIAPSEYASLSDVADYCEESIEREQALRTLLISRLTLCKPDPDQEEVVLQPWRSIFTTNFDDIVERSLPTSRCQVITPSADPGVQNSNKTPLYYMHGRALDLLETDHDPRLVISERNYLQLHEDNRALYARLKNELFCAKLIVIVGYSMRDLEVARILIEGGHAFRRKTLIICSANETAMALSRLKKFGQPLPIGLAGLAAQLRSQSSNKSGATSDSFQFIKSMRSVEAAKEISGDDFINLILTGSFSREKYQSQIQQYATSAELYCIRRKAALDTILQRSATGVNRFIVSSDLANGKSIFLDQLTEELLAGGHKVFRISSNLTEVYSEIELALATPQPIAFLIDDTIRHRPVVEFLGTRLNSLCILVCSARGDAGSVGLRELANSLGGASRIIDLDRLSLEELRDWDLALERWGLWEQRISLPVDQRIAFLTNECSAENRSIVLSLFRSSKIATKIDQLVSFFVKDGRHERAFAALLTSSLCQQHVAWESIVSWLDIDEDKL
jgi:translation initiation factor 2 beta subunit (eIF-2beta)/eIF-5